MPHTSLILIFSRDRDIELSSAKYSSMNAGENVTRMVVRGKTPGAFHGAGTFQWTSAVRALCAVALRHVLHQIDSTIAPQLQGPRGSLASSLDYAVSKGPHWLLDLFGPELNGEQTAKRLFQRTNPNMKRAGPVVISINPKLLSPRAIKILVNNKAIVDIHALTALHQQLEFSAVEESGDLDTTIDGAEAGFVPLKLIGNS